MNYEYIIETPDKRLLNLASEFLSSSNLKDNCTAIYKPDCGDFYILNHKKNLCLDYLSYQLSKEQFIKRIHFWIFYNSSSTLFDQKALAVLDEQISPDWTQKIVDSFLVTTKKHLPILYSALEQNDHTQLAKTAHYLKSSCAVVGASDLNTFCEICLEKTKFNEPWTDCFRNRLQTLSQKVYTSSLYPSPITV